MNSRKERERQHQTGDVLLAQTLNRFAYILLRLGVNAPQAERLLRTAFIQAAETYARSHGVRPNQSQLAMLAGINRIDVRNFSKIRTKVATHRSQERGRLERVLEGWRRDAVFRDPRGKPRPLSYRGRRSDFSRLVRKYGKDVTSKSLLDQLLRTGSVTKRADFLLIARSTRGSSPEASAANSDLRFLEAQLKSLTLQRGERKYVTKTASIHVANRKVANRVQRMTLAKVQLMLGSLDAIADQELPRPGARSHRIIVTTTVTTESGSQKR